MWLGKNTTVTQTKILEFFSNLEKDNLTGSKCKSCGFTSYPPRSGCPKCYSSNFEFISLPKKGQLAAFTQIHYGPTAFASDTPYTIGLLELEDMNLRIMGWIKNIPISELKIGMDLQWKLISENGENYLLLIDLI